MKAVHVNGWGQPVQIEDIPQSVPDPDEVLVRVHAASINPFDAFVHAGYMQGMLSIPLTLGTGFAGEVVEAGPEVGHVKPGDAVYGLVPMHSGSFAEYVVAKANEVTHKPKTMDFVQAAGVPLSALAAYHSLFELAQLQKRRARADHRRSRGGRRQRCPAGESPRRNPLRRGKGFLCGTKRHKSRYVPHCFILNQTITRPPFARLPPPATLIA